MTDEPLIVHEIGGRAMAIGAISGNYMNPNSIPARTGRGKSLGNDAVKNKVNSGYEVVQYPTTYIYCHQACKEFDTSQDGNQCQFGIYYEDGSALDIYKSPGYTNEMPLVDIYTRNPDVSYEDIFVPQNWVERVARWMQYQIEGGEYAAHKRFACLYTAFTDYMVAILGAVDYTR